VEALRNARKALKPGGTVIVVDERAAETPTHPGDEVERVFAAASLVWWPNDQVLAERPGVCLPRGLVGIDRRPVEALIGPGRMWVLGGAAGCLAVEVVAVDHRFWRLYRLVS